MQFRMTETDRLAFIALFLWCENVTLVHPSKYRVFRLFHLIHTKIHCYLTNVDCLRAIFYLNVFLIEKEFFLETETKRDIWRGIGREEIVVLTIANCLHYRSRKHIFDKKFNTFIHILFSILFFTHFLSSWT